ncbi:MAG: zinc ribbon domain-containing protein [Phycisphaerae bacterium]
MGATLDALHHLQEIELRIAEIQRGIDRKVRIRKKQERRIAEIDAAIRDQRDQIHRDQMEVDRFDLEVKSGEAEIDKYRQALNTSKNNKEYSALLTQLNTCKADNSKLEERVLSLLAQIDEKKKQMAAVEEERERETAKLRSLEEQVRQVEERASGRLKQLRAERDVAAAALPAQTLEMFNRVARRNEGEAMAPVRRTNPKRQEFACLGCNMSITIEQVNAILSRDDPVLCKVCGRILYMESSGAPRPLLSEE